MGYNLECIAFKSRPDVDKLKRLSWIRSFRIFGKVRGQEWYIEGPHHPANERAIGKSDAPSNQISFYQPLRLNWWWHWGRHTVLATNQINKLRAAIAAESDDWQCLNGRVLMNALKLSADLRTELLAVFGDDEGMDGGILCSKGGLAGGRMLVDGERVLTFDADGNYRIDPLDAPHGRMIHGIASEETARFFGGALASTNFYRGYDPEDYDLLASSGR